MKPLTFNPQPNLLAGLFAKWAPLYVKQRPMGDEEAEPFQAELCDIEKQIGHQPIKSMQDFYRHHTTMTCLGSMAGDYTVETTNAVAAIAVAEADELQSLQDAIAEHIRVYDELNALLAVHDGDEPVFESKGGKALADRDNELLNAIARHPARSYEAIVLKGRYFAARQARGDLGFYHAEAFIASFANREAV